MEYNKDGTVSKKRGRKKNKHITVFDLPDDVNHILVISPSPSGIPFRERVPKKKIIR
jgi:hypothetical protein